MKLYLKINKPDGRRMRLIDPRTVRIIPGSEVVLYPSKPTEVKDGQAYIDQAPHVVSDKPYSEKADPNLIAQKERAKALKEKGEPGRAMTPAEILSKQKFMRTHNQVNNPRELAIIENADDTDYMAYEETMAMLAATDLDPIKTKKPLQAICNSLDVKFTSKNNVESLKALINERAEFITGKMEEQLAGSQDEQPEEDE